MEYALPDSTTTGARCADLRKIGARAAIGARHAQIACSRSRCPRVGIQAGETIVESRVDTAYLALTPERLEAHLDSICQCAHRIATGNTNR